MTDPQAPLSEDPNDFCFIDAETCNMSHSVDLPCGQLPEVGADVYTDGNAFANIWTFAIGNDPVDIRALDNGFEERILWADMPDSLKRFHDRALEGKAWYVAWNMNFDWHVWNGSESDFPLLRHDMALDAMVQGASSGLPGKLEHAGRACGFSGKYEQGGKLMPLFANWGKETSLTRPDLWAEYKRYGVRDTGLLRNIFQATRSLPRQEWEDYWVSERINRRGFAVDVGFARRAAAVADANISRINATLVRATNGQITKVTQVARMCTWVYDRLETAEARDLMVKAWELDEEDDLKPAKISLAKDRIRSLLAYFNAMDPETMGLLNETTRDVLDHRLYGGSASPAKYGKIVRMQNGGVLRGQYTFNGAPQTGRYSSRGVQIHNLLRESLGEKEAEFIELVNTLELEDAC